jgi:3-oxoacyl-[acyl-carrier protein] reductase
MMLLKGKKAIVTGGARGIGKEIVMKFLTNGATVYFLDLNESEHLAEYQAAAKAAGCEVFFKAANVADEEAITKVIDGIFAEAGEIDVIVNNAGITRDNLLMRMTGKEWMDVININLSSAFYVCKAAVRPMLKARKGSIINVSSIVGVMGNAGQINYSSSKAGLIGLTKSMAKEVGSRGIRVNAIAPGFIKTKMTEALTEDVQKKMIEQIPLGRYGEASEVADAILFLASDLSVYITGQVLQVTGGMGM